MREAIRWLVALIALLAAWLAIPIALLIFDRPPPDTPPDAFLGVGPPWLYLILPMIGLATILFVIAVVIRLGFLVTTALTSHFRAGD